MLQYITRKLIYLCQLLNRIVSKTFEAMFYQDEIKMLFRVMETVGSLKDVFIMGVGKLIYYIEFGKENGVTAINMMNYCEVLRQK